MEIDLANNAFMISCLPRSGSTTLAALLNRHKDIRCLIEPFHPNRYGGRPNEFARRHSMAEALGAIWSRWNGIKHVWESNGWPFIGAAHLNEQIYEHRTKVIFLIRRNLLRRYVSNHICRQTHFWIGTQDEFRSCLKRFRLRPLSREHVAVQLEMDRAAISRSLYILSNQKVPHLAVYYEDLFKDGIMKIDRLYSINNILNFLAFSRLSLEEFSNGWQQKFDPSVNRWASEEIYRCIPGIDDIEAEFGSDENGWLFR